ncbi:MAG: Gfo/Idh/MocA family oxidoreductase [Bryobacteraceae bacterium]|nr:Gfo/Idh/MocA family oxidoreductase [Bryobacteraceae bacterium]
MKALLFLAPLAAAAFAADVRLGMIGTDTSHVIAFTQAFNGPPGPDHVDGAKVVAAYKGGSPDVESSHTRVDKYAEELQSKWNIEIVPRIGDLCSKVDAILLESVDGRAHLPQFREAVKCGKPVFIDKPLAATLEDAREIAAIAKKANVKWFSASSLRWSEIATSLKPKADAGDATAITTWGPGPFEPHHYLDLSWYAIHPVELLYTLMGPGCVEVSRISGADADVVVGKWKDGRIGTVHALRKGYSYGAAVFKAKETAISPPDAKSSYTPMLRELIPFLKGGPPPVPNDETLEIFAFMDAAQKSKEQGGKPTRLR